MPLIHGYTVVLANEIESMQPDRMAECIKRNHVNIIQTTPTKFKILFDKKNLSVMQQLDIIVSAGETLTEEVMELFMQHTHARVFNALGPSECTVWNVCGEISRGT